MTGAQYVELTLIIRDLIWWYKNALKDNSSADLPFLINVKHSTLLFVEFQSYQTTTDHWNTSHGRRAQLSPDETG